MPRGILTILLLVCSNAFMTLAWYGHIVFKSKLERVSLAAIVLLSWGVALFEYCFQVPANRIGSVEYGGPVHAVATESDSGGNHAYRLLLLRVVFQQERIASMESHRRVLLSGTGRLFYFQAIDGRRNDQKGPDVRSGLFACPFTRMKFVRTGSSGSGRGILPVWIFFSSHAMLSPSVRMVCIPSASCVASPAAGRVRCSSIATIRQACC